MESEETPTTPRHKLKRAKVAEPLPWEDYQDVKGRYPHLDWNDEDQSYTTKKGTTSYARKLFYFKPLTPEQIKMGRDTQSEQSRDKWDKFLQHLASGLRVSQACKRVGLTYRTVKNRYYDDPAFREKWEDAEAQAAEPVEDSLYNAALNGNVPAALEWVRQRSPDRWPGPKQTIEHKNVYELDASDRIGNIVALMTQLQRRAELDAGPQVIDVEAEED